MEQIMANMRRHFGYKLQLTLLIGATFDNDWVDMETGKLLTFMPWCSGNPTGFQLIIKSTHSNKLHSSLFCLTFFSYWRRRITLWWSDASAIGRDKLKSCYLYQTNWVSRQIFNHHLETIYYSISLNTYFNRYCKTLPNCKTSIINSAFVFVTVSKIPEQYFVHTKV